MGYSIDATDAGCYPGTTVLINKLNIQTQEALDRAERIAVSLREVEIEKEQPSEAFTFDYYLNLHRRLFGDVYDWAGKLRSIDFSKKGTIFCSADELASVGAAIFDRLQRMHELRGLPRDRFTRELAALYHDLNMLHPFREGNGRVQRLFFTLLIRRAGYAISFADCDTDALMAATIYAAQGVMDYLYQFFDREIRLS